MKKLTKLSALLVTIFILASCEKDPINPGIDPKPVSKKLWKIKTNDKDSTLFAYTTTGELFKVITTEEKEKGEKLTYTIMYDPTSRVSEISSSDGSTFKFVYQSNKLRLTENFAGTRKVSENHFEYAGNRLTDIVLFVAYSPDNGDVSYKPTLKSVYEYDAGGQVKKITTYLVNSANYALTRLGEKEFNQYDNKQNPLTILAPFVYAAFYEVQGEHNIVKETVYDEQGAIEKTTVNSYVYDADNYPVTGTSVVTSATGSPTTNTIQYFYK